MVVPVDPPPELQAAVTALAVTNKRRTLWIRFIGAPRWQVPRA
jgi:hypothetical protein